MIKLEKEYDVMNLTRNKSKILRDSNQLFLSCPHKDEFEEAQEASDSNNLSRTRAKTKSSFYSRLGKLADIEDIDNANEIKYSLDCADIASGLGDEGILDLNFQEDYEGFSFSASSKFSKLSEIVHEPHDNQDINEDSEIINSTVLFKLEELSLKRHLLSASFKFKTF